MNEENQIPGGEEPQTAAEGGQLEWERVGGPPDGDPPGEALPPPPPPPNRILAALKSLWFKIAALAAILVLVILWIAPRPADYPDLAIEAVAASDFTDTGIVYLTGFDTLTAEELRSAIRLEPETGFTVAIPADRPDRAVLTLENPRNIAYTLDFSLTVAAPAPPDAGQGGPFTKLVEYSAVLNGPALTVTIPNVSRIDAYTPLELKFSEQVDVQSLEENLSITPRTRYTLEYDAVTVLVYPEDSWVPGENYTVTVGSGYKSRNGKQFANAQSLSYEIQLMPGDILPPAVVYASNKSYVLSADRDMTLAFDGYGLSEEIPVVVETYRVPSLEQYREQGAIYLEYDVPLGHLEHVDSNVFLVQNGENQFPMAHPGMGAYILTADFTDPRTGEPVQERSGYLITDYSVYMQSSVRDTLVWLNKSGEGALGGYSLYYGDSEEPAGVTAADGTIVTDDSAFEPVYTDDGYEAPRSFSIRDPEGELVYYDLGVNPGGYHEERYYAYLFTDRTLYRPEDAVSFWGYVKPYRNNKLPMPATVTVTFDPAGLALEEDLAVSPSGVFSGEIPLERIKSSQYELAATLDFPPEKEGEPGLTHTLDSVYLSVKEFTKPAYVLSSVVDKDFYGAEDQVSVTVSAAFYDGTPLPHFPVEVAHFQSDTSEWSALTTLETDENGNVTFSFPAWEGGGYSPDLTYNRYMAQIASDGESATHVGDYAVFPSEVLVETELARDAAGGNLSLAIHTYELDLASPALAEELSAREEDADGYFWLGNERLLEIARGGQIDVEDVTVSLRWDYFDTRSIRHRFIYEQYGSQIFFGNSYSLDYMTRYNPGVQVLTDPNTSEKLVKVSTVNGEAILGNVVYLEEGEAIDFTKPAYCRAYLSYTDGMGNECDVYAYYPDSDSYREDWEERKPTPGYSFTAVNTATGLDVTPSYADYYSEITVDVGDTIHFELMLDDMPAPTEDGRILYSLIQDGIMERRIVPGNSLDFTYQLAYGTSLKLVAVYFDGTGTRAVRQIDVTATPESFGLAVEVTPDRESYRPGDPVSLSVKATDRDGNAVAGNLCVAVVDESIFALSEQYVDVFDGLYDNVRYMSNYVNQYFTTYRDEVELPMAGGKGDGGGVEFYDSYRSNFKDTALFLPVTLDSAGAASLSFELPDNTTSWRITAVAVGGNLMAGQSKSNIISTLPFFAKPVLTAKYIEGDELSMLIQGHGVLLGEESELSYSVTVNGDNFTRTLTAEGKAYEAKELNFGSLPVGSYTVISTASFSGYSDTVELPVNVIKSNLELVVNKPLDLTQPINIEAMRYPVTLTFYDRENQPFITSVSSLFGHYCMQTSQRLSRVVAKEAIRSSMPGEEPPVYIADTSENIADMQNEDGGIGPYPDSLSEPLLTTYVLMAAGGRFNEPLMAEYYRAQLAVLKDPKEIAACHLGLAVLGELDAAAITAELERAERLDVKAYYIAALASIGDTDGAGRLYEELCAPHVAERDRHKDYSATAGELAWERDAAAAWIAASVLRHPDADALSLHFGSFHWRYRTLYECMIYVSHYAKVIPPTNLSYSISGQQRDFTLGVDAITMSYGDGLSALMHTVALNKSELESFELLSHSGNLAATAYYIGEPTEIGIEPSDNMTVEKAIAPLGDDTYEVTVTIRLGENAPAGQYDLSDWIPSNSRLYTLDEDVVVTAGGRRDTDSYSFSARQENQNLYASFDNRKQGEKTIEFRYQIRKAYDSEAVLDTVYLIHGDTGENCNSVKSVWQP